jgi:hypothetical protein
LERSHQHSFQKRVRIVRIGPHRSKVTERAGQSERLYPNSSVVPFEQHVGDFDKKEGCQEDKLIRLRILHALPSSNRSQRRGWFRQSAEISNYITLHMLPRCSCWAILTLFAISGCWVRLVDGKSALASRFAPKTVLTDPPPPPIAAAIDDSVSSRGGIIDPTEVISKSLALRLWRKLQDVAK